MARKRRIKIEPAPCGGYNSLLEVKNFTGWYGSYISGTSAWGGTKQDALNNLLERLSELEEFNSRMEESPVYIPLEEVMPSA